MENESISCGMVAGLQLQLTFEFTNLGAFLRNDGNNLLPFHKVEVHRSGNAEPGP